VPLRRAAPRGDASPSRSRAVLTIVPLWRALGSEFMPPLWEGDLLYMPITMPGISVTQAQDLLGAWTAS
jgi:Cu/Ag efflux pump CusA